MVWISCHLLPNREWIPVNHHPTGIIPRSSLPKVKTRIPHWEEKLLMHKWEVERERQSLSSKHTVWKSQNTQFLHMRFNRTEQTWADSSKDPGLKQETGGVRILLAPTMCLRWANFYSPTKNQTNKQTHKTLSRNNIETLIPMLIPHFIGGGTGIRLFSSNKKYNQNLFKQKRKGEKEKTCGISEIPLFG